MKRVTETYFCPDCRGKGTCPGLDITCRACHGSGERTSDTAAEHDVTPLVLPVKGETNMLHNYDPVNVTDPTKQEFPTDDEPATTPAAEEAVTPERIYLCGEDCEITCRFNEWDERGVEYILRSTADAETQQLREALRQIELHHKAVRGEAGAADPNHYCSVCVAPSGRSRIHPCRTVKLARAALQTGGE